MWHSYLSEAYSLINAQCLPRDYTMKAEIYGYACGVAQVYQCCQLLLARPDLRRCSKLSISAGNNQRR